jgi:hypothetical protein
MTSQGSAHGRFTRAIQQRNLWAAEMSLRELETPTLEAALAYLDLLAEQSVRGYRPHPSNLQTRQRKQIAALEVGAVLARRIPRASSDGRYPWRRPARRFQARSHRRVFLGHASYQTTARYYAHLDLSTHQSRRRSGVARRRAETGRDARAAIEAETAQRSG